MKKLARSIWTVMVASLLVAAGIVGWMFVKFAPARERHVRELEMALRDLRQAQDQLIQSGDKLRIDRSFTDGFEADRKDAAIIRALVAPSARSS